ncbi:MAG: Bro-N domain-containing protein [Rikenellaceae bacterium]
MGRVAILSHPAFGEVRSVVANGKSWFVAKDVCSVLGLKDGDTSLRKFDDDEKGSHTMHTLGGDQKMTVINESGLYHLIILSRKPEAKAFRKWVTDEVLPSIRKNGFYIHPSLKLTSAQQRKLNDTMRGLVNQYITDQDVARCAKRCGRATGYVRDVLRGYITNNGIMDELQTMAIKNKEQMDSPYSPERLQEVITELSR